MIIGTGIDIVNIERIEHLMTRWERSLSGWGLYNPGDLLVSTPSTRARVFCHPVRGQRGFSQSNRMGARNGIQWTGIEVVNDSMGKPMLSFHRKAKEVYQKLRIEKALLTLSHDRLYAVAHALLEEGNHESSDR